MGRHARRGPPKAPYCSCSSLPSSSPPWPSSARFSSARRTATTIRARSPPRSPQRPLPTAEQVATATGRAERADRHPTYPAPRLCRLPPPSHHHRPPPRPSHPRRPPPRPSHHHRTTTTTEPPPPTTTTTEPPPPPPVALLTPTGIPVAVVEPTENGYLVRTPCGNTVEISGGERIEGCRWCWIPATAARSRPARSAPTVWVERDLNLILADAVLQELADRGITAATTRTGDYSLYLSVRADFADALGAAAPGIDPSQRPDLGHPGRHRAPRSTCSRCRRRRPAPTPPASAACSTRRSPQPSAPSTVCSGAACPMPACCASCASATAATPTGCSADRPPPALWWSSATSQTPPRPKSSPARSTSPWRRGPRPTPSRRTWRPIAPARGSWRLPAASTQRARPWSAPRCRWNCPNHRRRAATNHHRSGSDEPPPEGSDEPPPGGSDEPPPEGTDEPPPEGHRRTTGVVDPAGKMAPRRSATDGAGGAAARERRRDPAQRLAWRVPAAAPASRPGPPGRPPRRRRRASGPPWLQS